VDRTGPVGGRVPEGLDVSLETDGRHRGRGDGSVVTLADVAALAGVSPATATRALRGLAIVRPETRARVKAAASSLGYVPDLTARALVTRSTRTIGLLIPSSSDGFWGGVTEGLEARAAAAGFAMLVAASHSDPDRERATIELFLGKRVDGIVIGSAAGATWEGRRGAPPPMVLVNWDAALGPDLMDAALNGSVEAARTVIAERTRTDALAHVRTDDFWGAAEATRHLVALGHTRIAFAGARPVRPALLRLLGFRSALAEAGIEPAIVVRSAGSLEGGVQAGQAILARADRPTAVVAFDDMVAVGIVRAAHALGLRVPDDLSVTGFDDVPVAAFVEPPLTTLAQDTAALGRLAVDVILAQLRTSTEDIATVVPGHLVVRQSTAPPRGAR
jgi:LacI family transcriptional regulator